ncbi:hypothetical protein [Actinomadura chokoriensis]|uniref:Uncharacterized protein n=1 Tax=Actinomadura chokoriensis TaxID=454156 RepID=A0ABV4QZ59_9ACTN
MSGPYDTEGDVAADVRDLYAAYCKPGVARARTFDMLLRTCAENGVELGAYDREVLRWLAGLAPEKAQVVASLIARVRR